MDELEMELEFDGEFIVQPYDFRKTFEFKNENFVGSIVLALPVNASVSVAIGQNVADDVEYSQFRIYCSNDVDMGQHRHILYVDAKMPDLLDGAVPIASEADDETCLWYIPIDVDAYSLRQSVTIYVKGIVKSVAGISAELADMIPQRNVYPSSVNVPVTPNDNGKMMIVKDGVWSAVKFNLENGSGENSVQQSGTSSSHQNSVVFGSGTVSSRRNQTTLGEHNAASVDSILVVGNGSEDIPSNAFEVHKDGRATVNGLPINEYDVVVKKYADKMYVPIKKNATDLLGVYTQIPEKDGGGITLRSISAYELKNGIIPARLPNGQLLAPNQNVYPPSDDQYVSKRFTDRQYVPAQTPDTRYLSFIAIGNDGIYRIRPVSSTVANENMVPLRGVYGQLLAPNQDVYAPSIDHYVAKRYVDGHYVPKIVNNTTTLHVYAQMAEKDGGAVVIKTASPSNASQGVFPIRAANGQIKAPNQNTHTPDLDDFISRRYFEAHLPSSGGGKLYRHSIRIMSYEGGFWSCEVYFTLYTRSATQYNDVDELPLKEGESVTACGNYDPHDMSEAVYPVTRFIYNNLTPRFEYFYSPNEYDQKTKCGRDIFTIERGGNVLTIFEDTVTEV